jgi:hypothetical protein
VTKPPFVVEFGDLWMWLLRPFDFVAKDIPCASVGDQRHVQAVSFIPLGI